MQEPRLRPPAHALRSGPRPPGRRAGHPSGRNRTARSQRPAPWARAPLRTARPRRLYSLPMAAAGRPTGHGGSARSALGSPGWASAPLQTRSGGCAQTPPRITWPACGSRSPAPWGRAWAPGPTSSAWPGYCWRCCARAALRPGAAASARELGPFLCKHVSEIGVELVWFPGQPRGGRSGSGARSTGRFLPEAWT